MYHLYIHRNKIQCHSNALGWSSEKPTQGGSPSETCCLKRGRTSLRVHQSSDSDCSSLAGDLFRTTRPQRERRRNRSRLVWRRRQVLLSDDLRPRSDLWEKETFHPPHWNLTEMVRGSRDRRAVHLPTPPRATAASTTASLISVTVMFVGAAGWAVAGFLSRSHVWCSSFFLWRCHQQICWTLLPPSPTYAYIWLFTSVLIFTNICRWISWMYRCFFFILYKIYNLEDICFTFNVLL